MAACWRWEPASRPSFQSILDLIAAYIEAGEYMNVEPVLVLTKTEACVPSSPPLSMEIRSPQQLPELLSPSETVEGSMPVRDSLALRPSIRTDFLMKSSLSAYPIYHKS